MPVTKYIYEDCTDYTDRAPHEGGLPMTHYNFGGLLKFEIPGSTVPFVSKFLGRAAGWIHPLAHPESAHTQQAGRRSSRLS